MAHSLAPFSEAESCSSSHLWPWVWGQPGLLGGVASFPTPMDTEKASLREKSLLMLIFPLR